MTDKQMKAIRETLYAKPRAEWNDEDKRLSVELSCIDMINSILIYNNNIVTDYAYKRYLMDYINGTDYVKVALGKARVDELIAQQQQEVAKAIVKVAVYEDSEGCTYNSIVWADEQ